MWKSLNLGTERIGPLFVKMALPSVIAMVVNGLYYMIDTVFVGRGVGVHALGGLAIVFPIQVLMIAIGSMIALGTASIVSRRLGENDAEGAKTAAGNAVVIAIIAGIALALTAGLIITPLLRGLGATAANIEYGGGYLSTLLYGFVFVFLSFVGVSLVRAEGNAILAMIGMILGAVINAALDPLFIFVMGMGVEGAALATVIARLICTMLYAAYFFRGGSLLRFSLKHLRLRFCVVREIVALGLGSFLSQLSLSLLALVMNLSLRHYGNDLYMSLYGVLGRILIFVNMPILGLAQGLQPIVGFNYGARNLGRVKHALVVSIFASIVVGGIICAFLNGVPRAVLGVFTNSPELLAIGIGPLRITTMLIPLIGVQIIAFSYFQALGRPFAALITSLSREFLILVPLLLFLPLVLGLHGVWIAYPVADALSVVSCLIWMRWQQRKLGEEVAFRTRKAAFSRSTAN